MADGMINADETGFDIQQAIRRAFACSDEDVERLRRCASSRSYAARGVILRQGEVRRDTLLLAAGKAQAILYAADGRFALLHDYRAGDLLGVVAHEDSSLVEADVLAVEAARVVMFLSLEFLRLVETRPAIAMAVSRILLNQLRAATERLAAQMILSANGRIHAELLRLAREGDGRVIRPTPVLSELAVRVNSTRETVSRAISALERRGVVRREPDALIVVAPQRLEALVL